LLIRSDAGPLIGAGHVMRCLALAQAWQDSGGRVAYAMAPGAPKIESRLAAEGIDVILLDAEPGSEADGAETCRIAERLKADWLVLDGYQFGAEYQRAVKRAGFRLLAVDDYAHASHYWADLILNQDINIDETLYGHREPYTQVLFGSPYVLIRREFLSQPRREGPAPETARKILVTLGGADPDNVTLEVIEALRDSRIAGLEACVVVGPSNPRFSELEAAASSAGGSIRVLQNVTNMPELMAWCDMAVTAGGSTVWELAYMGIPSMILIVADNQASFSHAIARKGAALLLGESRSVGRETLASEIAALAADRPRRESLGGNLSALADGRGAERVCKAMIEGMHPS
jgi:UDP-2,4-diacetamido-2,4,6-trideoxy-beta-L-altropyranose hydrolase